MFLNNARLSLNYFTCQVSS
uniref:Uncharacterized protein n=1 Tax=Anguilla anguilla TaxID=7936 RepID=A0A0E9RXZ5_ANGAN